MKDLHHNAAANTTDALSKTANGHEPERATIYTGDIRQPWKSVFGFPMTAARLAAGQGLHLHCREDEVVEMMGNLNELLESPESLDRAYKMLENLQEMTKQKLAGLITLREQPITDDEISELLADVVQLLNEPQPQTVTDRLACILSPNHPIEEIAGMGKMLARLQKLVAALDQVKDKGFRVTVRDRRRKLMRPALESCRNKSTAGTGCLPPPKYHLTLWTYLVARGEAGQSNVSN